MQSQSEIYKMLMNNIPDRTMIITEANELLYSYKLTPFTISLFLAVVAICVIFYFVDKMVDIIVNKIVTDIVTMRKRISSLTEELDAKDKQIQELKQIVVHQLQQYSGKG
jgi:hypothetical protein